MSTYLQLSQDLRQESTDSGSGPSTVIGQSGEHGRFVKWIRDAWSELQNEHDDWLWMRRGFTVNTVADDGEYAYGDCTDTTTSSAITRFARWYKGRYDWKCYLQSAGVGGEYFLEWLDWEDFKFLYRKGTQVSSQPMHVSMDPSQKFVLGPKPSAVYVVTGDYQMSPQTLAVDADIPEMPSRFHSLIVYRAMVKYGFNSVATEVLQRASIEGGRLQAALVRDQRPPITTGSSLA